MAGGTAVNLAKAYVTLVPSFQGATASIAKELGALNVSGAGRTAGKSYANGMASALSNGFGGMSGAVRSAASAAGAHFSSMVSQAQSAAQQVAQHFSGIATATVSAFATASAATTAAVAGLTASSLSAYSNYEQLTGGVETLFGDSASTVEAYAAAAYANAGISANEYMEQATSFSATLLQSLGGDTRAAAEYANTAINDMGDNANKMGTSIESIQNAYQGFAKQNYTMLDNLKLGYGGTASEMARLVNDSGVLGDTMTVTADNLNEIGFDTMIEAIHEVQTQMGITGTTALEASTTIEGSVNSAKAAYQNWLVALADDAADVGTLTDQLVASVATAAGNILPRVQAVLLSLSAVIQEYVPQLTAWLAESLPSIVEQVTSLLTSILTSAGQVLPAVVNTIIEGLPMLVEGVATVISTVLESLREQMPAILGTISAALPQIIQTVVEFLTSSVPTIVDLGLQLFVALVQNLPTAISTIAAALPEIISSVVDTLLAHIDEIIEAGVELLVSLVKNMPAVITAVVSALPGLVGGMTSALIGHIPDFVSAGFDMLMGLATGIANAIPSLIGSALAACGELLSNVLGFFGIASPSRLMRDEVGKFLPLGIASGIEGATGAAVAQMEESAREIAGAASVDATVGVGASGAGAFSLGAASGTVYNVYLDGDALDVDGRISEALQSLVDAVAQGRRNGARGAVAYA